MSEIVKIVVFCPETHTAIVEKAMGDAGSGKLGNYSHCTFVSKGVGHYLPMEGANPHIGSVGKFEEVKEDRVEAVCERSKLQDVIKAIRSVHPYEEIAMDVYPLE